ncbi:MAG: hypothetical protein HZB75_00735 [Candidatus Saccharibacteria bacterium]|nr:MAG: hypothetical protein HZB75_00735 [Candidatus Saccharibacteria bacterium]
MDKNDKFKKAWYKRVWVWIGIIFLIAIVGTSANGNQSSNTSTPTTPVTETPKEETPAEWNVDAVYGKIKNGMTKAQVEKVTNKDSESCTENSSEYLGKTEICTYGSVFIDKAVITVTYSQDKVNSKTKSTY